MKLALLRYDDEYQFVHDEEGAHPIFDDLVISSMISADGEHDFRANKDFVYYAEICDHPDWFCIVEIPDNVTDWIVEQVHSRAYYDQPVVSYEYVIYVVDGKINFNYGEMEEP